MNQITLEFRGIPLKHLMAYLTEIGGEKVTSHLPYRYMGPYWTAEILKEQEVQITSTFRVGSVHICFKASSTEQLDQVIAAFRKKTMRAGG
ncbi:hypothetical protein [Ammoniphilus sp. CFH 90114]|uniref:hypothetical protein n=1 Tax=Ammoniphilus sp. CFH 90114 TaxID=2493665 RepID=UPI00100E0627|nr:hypothetical protein [Ammoniphilus sp. CFH 90114]RXT05676.1 hypothetical protein EIZ39_16320 [Ammoniphilus sp. CFH 90114]